MINMRKDIEEQKNHNWSLEDYEPYPEFHALKKSLSWFQDQKVGLLIHWGLYAQAGIVESWQLSAQDQWARQPTAFRSNMAQLQRDYWKLANQFSPTHYDPYHWAELFRQAGITYAIFTTKHHDGFNMYDTNASNYKITNPHYPYHNDRYEDVFGAFTKAMRQANIAVGAYYSKADWYSENYWPSPKTHYGRTVGYDIREEPEKWTRYVHFVHQQLQEITTQYGPLAMLWLDAGWVKDPQEPLHLAELMDQVRSRQPQMLVVDRTVGGRFENYVTPERQIPTLATRPTIPWESNIPLARNWGYIPHDQYKSTKQIISDLLKIVTLGGNVVFGVGPTAQGLIPTPAKKALHDLGGWLSLNGDGIYGTRACSPEIIQATEKLGCAITEKADAYYLFPMKERQDRIDLHQLPIAPIKKVVSLGQSNISPGIVDGCIHLPGSFSHALFPGMKLIKAEVKSS
ncbi:alpha-L-fucosidase [Schleiferilactobacillus perolens]|uniref:alpha-L-fucosidase n=1 Tax=Schleiferilactobacillus perolens DSM 12744 TaxID=1423792 RepID=A0A0R1N4X2_9LACO|nr:alpha-L-fucosidase [Schleiferilactobacillus perolens DSM 12744]